MYGDRIVEAWFSRHREPFKTPATRQARRLEGRAILAVRRTGKHIVCELGGPAATRSTSRTSPEQTPNTQQRLGNA